MIQINTVFSKLYKINIIVSCYVVNYFINSFGKEKYVVTHTHKKINPTVISLHKDKTRPSRRMHTPFKEVNHFFGKLRTPDWMRSFHWPDTAPSHIPMFSEGKLPKVDIIDKNNYVLIRAELPGVDKKNLDISMTGNSVTIKASTSYENKEEKSNYYQSEIEYGQYIRTLTLPADVDIEQAKSSFKNGVLELTVPKVEHSQ